MYNWIFDNLRSLDLQTQLLEACGWDEDLMEEYTSLVGEGLDHTKGSDILAQVKILLADAPAEVVDVILTIVEKEAIDAFREMINPEVLN